MQKLSHRSAESFSLADALFICVFRSILLLVFFQRFHFIHVCNKQHQQQQSKADENTITTSFTQVLWLRSTFFFAFRFDF